MHICAFTWLDPRAFIFSHCMKAAPSERNIIISRSTMNVFTDPYRITIKVAYTRQEIEYRVIAGRCT